MAVRVVLLAAVLLSLILTQDTYLPVLTAQTTTTTVTKTVENPHGTYTIVEYPVKKEVIVDLRPSALLPDATGSAKILRDDDGTRIDLSVAVGGQKTDLLEKKGARYRGWQTSSNEFKTCVGAVLQIEDGVVTKTSETCKGTIVAQDNPKELNVYAVDDHGDVTALGPLSINNGIGRMTATTPLTKFMLVLSPEPALARYQPTTAVAFRSSVPEGFAVIPVTRSSGETVAATTTLTPGAAVAASYSAPLLNIPAYKKGDDTKLKLDFTGALTGARANVFITPHKDGPTEIRIRFHDLKEAPAGKSFILWAVSPEDNFVKLGRIPTLPGSNESEVKAETTLPDFGLLITMESTSTEIPTGPAIGIIHLVP